MPVGKHGGIRVFFIHSLEPVPGEEVGDTSTEHLPKEWVPFHQLLKHKAEASCSSCEDGEFVESMLGV